MPDVKSSDHLSGGNRSPGEFRLKGNPSQNAAITHFTGPCEVLAGPGSGKTFVLVERIRYLIEYYHVPPSKILVLTFSRAAAIEMRTRFLRKTESRYPGVTFGTFHSVFLNILRRSSAEELSLLSAAEQTGLVRTLIESYDGAASRNMEKLLPAALSAIGRIRCLGGSPDENKAEEEKIFCDLSRLFSPPSALREVTNGYAAFLRENGRMDFDDMILRTRDLLREDPAVLSRWQERFPFLLIDEFQDINPPQYEVCRMLAAAGSHNLFTVGDDDQAIYGFRGSDPAMMHRMPKDFPGTKQILLKINYRCSKPITEASLLVIGENRKRFPKEIVPNAKDGSAVERMGFAGEEAEYAWLLQAIRAMPAAEAAKTAVIFRNHIQAAALETRLKKSLLPFRGDKGGKDAKQAAVYQDLLAYCRLSADLSAGGVLRREDYVRVCNKPMRYLSREAAGEERIREEALVSFYRGRKNMQSTVRHFCDDLRCLSHVKPSFSVRYLFDTIGYRKYVLGKSTPSDRLRMEELLSGLEKEAERFPDLHAFRSFLETLAGEDGSEPDRTITTGNADTAGKTAPAVAAGIAGEADTASAAPAPGIRIMTMHASKGLEFDTVFLPDLNEGILPGRRAVTDADIEEERRLFYVAMTRAKKRLVLLYLTGTKENPRVPSRFLAPLGITPGFD